MSITIEIQEYNFNHQEINIFEKGKQVMGLNHTGKDSKNMLLNFTKLCDGIVAIFNFV